jgi:hypothetical protein
LPVCESGTGDDHDEEANESGVDQEDCHHDNSATRGLVYIIRAMR